MTSMRCNDGAVVVGCDGGAVVVRCDGGAAVVRFYWGLMWGVCVCVCMRLESESGLYCDVDHVQSLITNGDWDQVESYLAGFDLSVGADESTDILYKIIKQQFIEALRQERDDEALLILQKKMAGLEMSSNKINISSLLIKDKAGRDEFFGQHPDIVISRDTLGVQVREIIEKHPSLAQKCSFPKFDGSRLSLLCKQSLEWQHSKCQNKSAAVQYKSLLENHVCETPNNVRAPTVSQFDMRRFDGDYVYLAMQYFKERKFHKALHRLESESGLYCDVDHVQNLITTGDWDQVESYLAGFKIRVGEDAKSLAILFEIKKQQFLEALQQERDEEALFILKKQMVGLETCFNQTDMAKLLVEDKARRNDYFVKYPVTSRITLGAEVRKMIKNHPRLAKICRFPKFDASRLSLLCKQSLEWQHSKCQNKNPVVQYKGLLKNHVCETPNHGLAQVLSPNLNAPFMHSFQQGAGSGPPVKGPEVAKKRKRVSFAKIDATINDEKQTKSAKAVPVANTTEVEMVDAEPT